MKTLPPKPTKRYHVFAYDYHACRDYLQARDGYDEEDVEGTFTRDRHAPYHNFWHFVQDKDPEIRNRSAFVMASWWGEDAEPWQQAILQKYLEAFGEPDAAGGFFIQFYVSW